MKHFIRLLTLVFSLTPPALAKAPATKISDVHQLLILAAMDVEETALLKDLKYTTRVLNAKLGITVKESRAGSLRLLIAKSGIGPVNAGLTIGVIADHYPVDAILLLGVGGSVSPKLKIGDIVISRQVIEHDSVFSGDAGNALMAPGEPYVSVKAEERASPRYVAADFLVQLLSTSLKSDTAYVGTVFSGSEFVGTAARKKAIAALDDNGLLVDMEACAVAQMARKLDIPFAVAKTVADRMNPDGTIESDYQKFLKASADHAALVLTRFVSSAASAR